MTEFANIVDIFERTLSRPLIKEDLIKNKLGLKDIRALAIESRQEYNKKTVPQKNSQFEVRPFIDPTFNMGIMDYAIGGNISSNFENFVFDKKIVGKMSSSIKQVLLYSHSVVINDPLDYILDFFHLNQDENPPDYILGRIEAVNSLLIEYSDIADLIKARIVIPVEFMVTDLKNTPFPTKDSSALLLEKLKGRLSDSEIKSREKIIYSLIGRFNHFKGDADLFFPDQQYVHVLKEVLRSMEQKFSSHDIQVQLNASLLAQLKIPNTDKLTVKEIVEIRKNELLFQEWRDFLSKTLRETSSNFDNCCNLDFEFRQTVNSEINSTSGIMNRKIKTTNWGSNLDGFKNMGIGAIAGALPGVITNTPETITPGAIIGGMADSSIKTLLEFTKNIKDRKSNIALRSHFVAIGADIENRAS